MYIGKCVVDKTGIKELLGLGPSLSPGSTLYKDIYSYLFKQIATSIYGLTVSI